MSKFVDRTGQKFGKLTIVKELGGRRVLARCDCGTVFEVIKSRVANSGLKSCGLTSRDRS